ncbi:MAG: ATP-dependent helicase [Gammaproteobacteria bacterium]|nr:MAG: ATP-dependent helicase [Gammaproteobacteria bacterium]
MTTIQEHLQAITDNEPPPIERLWKMAKFTPNDAQRDAILHVDGPLYLTAGPGSGKTRVLLWRTLNLIVYHGVAPEKIFLSTFTEKAAKQLTDGLRSLLGLVTNHTGQSFDLSGMYVGTVHSLCHRLLSDRRRFFADRHRPRPPALLDDLGQYFHFNRLWDQIVTYAGLHPDDAAEQINLIFDSLASLSRHRAIENLRRAFNRFSEELLDPDVLQSRLGEFSWCDFAPGDVALLLRLYEGYRQTLQDNRVTDFALLQQEAYHVLENFPGSGEVFKHVIVDEYQDTNTIQERIFFKLSTGTKNLCVVGDDDQALYRFRGATVENFVQFPQRCQKHLGVTPRQIALDINYRSRSRIVEFYSQFMEQTNWRSNDGQTTYRVDKKIRAHRSDSLPAVVASTPSHPDNACEEIAAFVRRLLDEGKVENPNQIAFLYPSLKSTQVGRMRDALEAQGLQVYAPRAGRFLEVDEALDVFGVYALIFGKPGMRGMGRDVKDFRDWLNTIEARGETLRRRDPRLAQFINDRQEELKRALNDYHALLKVVERQHWDLQRPYDLRTMKRLLYDAPGLSETGRKLVSSAYFDRIVQKRIREGYPLLLNYVIRRATSLDWNFLDLFYRLMGFEHFKAMFDQAEHKGDEGPVANLGLITQYLQRFTDERVSIITADLLEEHKLTGIFFNSFLFALFRLGESEWENPEDPFPRGRIPFLTIHQAKGLEFPVVVLGNLYKQNRGAPQIEELVRPMLSRPQGEPLKRMTEFDIARMFYVALSRAQNLLVLAHFRGRGQNITTQFRPLLGDALPRIPDFDITTMPPATMRDEEVPKVYSFTADYLLYQKCPRQYMIFRKFGFVPSRSQTMFFGSLVHRTLEDLHHELIRRRKAAAAGGQDA